MEFFIDTADIEEIKQANELGILDGVTTNPSLVAKTGKPFKEVIREICEIVDGPVSAEVISTDKDGIVKEAKDLVKIADNVVIKVPLIPEGLKAVKILSSEGIATNVTLCFSSSQALLAAKAGATYISPFIGRVDDTSWEGMQLIEEIVQIYDNFGYETKVLAASIRGPLHLRDAALAGADVATIPFSVFQKLVHHPLTDIGLKRFLEDAKKFSWD
ncbi:MAG: fructose-6-phosphate aldolase [Candidatus Hydrogenedentota bacterium]|nr:MAG: fructose-6-phosphate aldolase [Candidatus Hydrogenedentota bacterium]